jgi:hypothetical protein
MKHNQLFFGDRHKQIEASIKTLINTQIDLLSTRSMSSARATGDVLQDLVAEHFQVILGDLCKEYSAVFARRAMADLAFKDVDDYYYVVDVKTHRGETGFHMPNLTSVERLARFYEDDSNYFVILLIDYSIDGVSVIAEGVHFVPIEFLSWKCLTLGALGWGQIQLANAERLVIIEGQSRRQWMLDLCDLLLEFYPREIAKIGLRIDYFRKVRERWEGRMDDQ